MDGRPRNYTNGGGDPRAPPNRPSTGGSRGAPSAASSGSAPSGMSRAERFDDERKRITESCFSKVDEQGQLQESYITHIRVQEDGGHPQSPPPPNSPTSSKKARVIMISVRNTGRVKLHKARENANGTFSIGKSWPMEELSAVENYVHLNPTSEEEAQRKQWAGEKGFTVTITKPYYWEAGTAKEKEFFIGSMVKIYNKYTKGDFPILTGFSVTELNSLTNGKPHLATPEGRAAFAASGQGGASPRQGPPEQRPMPPKAGGPSPRRPGEVPPLSTEDNRRGPPPPNPNPNFRRPPGELQGPRRPGRPDDDRPSTGDEARRRPPFLPSQVQASGLQGTPSMPDLRQKRSMDPSIRSRPSGDSIRPRPAQGPGPSPMAPSPQLASRNLTPQSSNSEFASRPKTPESGNLPASLSPGRQPPREDAQSQRSGKSPDEPSLDGAPPSIAPPDPRRQNGFSSPRRDPSPRGLRPGTAQSGARPGTAQSNASSNFTRNDDVPPEEPPQRRRPLMEPRPSQMSQRSFDSQGAESRSNFHTPSGSPAPPMEVPPRRRPQEIPERLKPASQENVSRPEATLPMSQPTPPPTSPLPQIPTASLPPAPAQDEVTVPPLQAISTETAPESEGQPEAPQTMSSPIDEQDGDASHRPGLGPMVKKPLVNDQAANKFRKAAAAAGAFKPRAGGAAAKLFNKETKASDEPDGVSAVFVPQRPTPKEMPKEILQEEEEKKPEDAPIPVPDRLSKERPRISTEVVPSVTVSGPLAPPVAGTMQEPEEEVPPPAPEKAATRNIEPEPEVRRKKRRSNQQIVNISKLGIDPAIIDERGLEFDSLLSELGWGSNELSHKRIESLETDIKREIARVEAGSWLNHLEQKDDRVEAVERMLDRAIAECDELEGLLTLYNVELSSLNDDIAFIEAQSQGLQVQTANQRLLQHELRQLVDTISITSDQLEPLRRAPIGKINGLKDIESSLVLLYKALVTIDPSFVAGSRAGASDALNPMNNRSGIGNSDLATMQALQEKRDRYLGEGTMFIDRLKKHMDITFGAAFLSTKDALSRLDEGSMPSLTKNVEAHDTGRSELWMLSPVMLFAKEIDRASWDTLLRMYQVQAAQLYQQEVRDNILAWRKFARKPTGEEQELLFTAQEKEPESITGTARKLTVKRSQTLARGLRSASGEKEGKEGKAKPATQDGKLHAFDVFARVLEDTGPVLLTEQNFITEFFHATSTDSLDFPDAVQAAPPENRRGPNLWIRKQFEPDRAMAKHVTGVMEEIFSFWPAEIASLVDWATKVDPLQGVGILCAVDRKLVDIEETNQDFLTRNLQKIHERLQGLFSRFLDEQIRAIEDTKVKIKKRKGVISFMKTFPHFSIAIENMLPSASEGGDQLEIRRMVNDGYQRINKAMFESLKVIAKESPTVMASQGQADPEDKEALNYHILLIENMNHYMEEVDARAVPVLDHWKGKAQDEYDEHMGLYVDAVIRRPLGKLLEFIESTETLLSQPGASAQAIAQRSSHSRSVFKKLTHSHDAKELRKGIESLKKRVDKHFGDADDPTISRDLVFKVLKECEKTYVKVSERMTTINQDVYSGEVEIDWGNKEVEAAFRR
ncbi:exocyst complex component protein [Stemphylium lycopersici]|uniref:Exocyst complex component protein n=1 Tax=Stemphylium lycopersici TaxID=183478 RepID=A0A364NGT3_STELY|nr:exocyst complex component protein [Stemphylium lycopersici]